MTWWDNPYRAEQKRMIRGLHGAGRDLDRKFWPAMALYAMLAGAIWFTLGDGTTLVLGKQIEIRWIPLLVIGTFAFRTYVAREADKIRRRGDRDAGKLL